MCIHLSDYIQSLDLPVETRAMMLFQGMESRLASHMYMYTPLHEMVISFQWEDLGITWYTLVYLGIPWYIFVYLGISWYTLIYVYLCVLHSVLR